MIYATLDLSGPYRKVFDTMLPDAVQVADPFHLVRIKVSTDGGDSAAPEDVGSVDWYWHNRGGSSSHGSYVLSFKLKVVS